MNQAPIQDRATPYDEKKHDRNYSSFAGLIPFLLMNQTPTIMI